MLWPASYFPTNGVVMPSEATINQIQPVAEEAVRAAGALARNKWLEPRHIDHKGFRDLVTDVDIAAQKLAKERIRAAFPHHQFLAEEDRPDAAAVPAGDVPVWILDPIDGTSNYSLQVPIFCVSLALVQNNQLQLGIIYDPIREEYFQAIAGQGATCNGQPIAARNQPDLGRAIAALDWGHSRNQRDTSLALLQRFAQHVHTIRALGSAALAMAWVAAGRLDAYVNYGLKSWDVAAAAVLIAESGGRLEQINGQPWDWRQVSTNCVVTNGPIHDAFTALLRNPA